MEQWTLYHNPQCSKSRQCLALLQQRGVSVQVVEYLKTPLNREQLETLRKKLDLAPREWIRTGEEEFKTLNVDLTSDDQVLDAIAAHPKLLQRPIAVRGEKAVVGRPPENVEALF